ncbi:four helix bundle protein [Arcicella aurantiaca]|uniref:Four helix bundle protein n=1 Tax=Arcicella aurantiaca TaxID=591202 RepID=A0A316DIP6_9BACT|nr:four helix bundle protein [Arcicella aurantiaca]PWK18051.1 four helix bundle protein [Arcicella aurantiaca]
MSTNNSIIKQKSFQFAVRIVKLYKHIVEKKKEFVLSKQLLRSGTSIGANVREAHNAESDADFIHKLSIAQKECDESLYWLELLKETEYLTELKYSAMAKDCTEVLKILNSFNFNHETKKENRIIPLANFLYLIIHN